MAASAPLVSPLDKPIINPTPATIPVATMIYALRAFNESLVSDEAGIVRVGYLGQQVGRRMVGLAIANDRSNQAQFRDLTTEEATRFIATVMWKRWFDRVAIRQFKHANYNFIEDDVSIIPIALSTNLTNDNCEGMSFVSGMIKGALEACGFNCEVHALVSEEPNKPSVSQFGIQWAPVVLQRDRRRLLQQ